ncbi:MAG: glycosyltransferase family 4 protein [Spirochaetales bacterium]|nr:glycosyltransferase family 4 protein [Spirochaetales bacterium]
MKIIYLHQYFNTPDMVGGTRSFEVAKRLVISGHEVHIVTTQREKKTNMYKSWNYTYESGIHVHWLNLPYSNKMSYFKRVVVFMKFAFYSSIKAISIKGDIVFATSTPLTIAIPGIFTAKKLKIPMILEVRDLWPEIPIVVGAINNPIVCKVAKILEKWAYKNSEAIIALSPGMRAGVINKGYDSSRVAVIPNSCDNETFQNVKQEDIYNFRHSRAWLRDNPLITYVGTFGLINGVSYLVDIASELLLINPAIKILLVGDGKEKNLVSVKAKNSGVLGVNLFIEDCLPKKDIPLFFAASTLSCSVVINKESLFHNSANKFFDSLSSGTPIFLNHGGWQADLLEATGAGFNVWNKSMKESAEIISRMISNKDWLKTAGKRSKIIATQIFDRNIQVEKLRQVLEAAYELKGNKAFEIAPGGFLSDYKLIMKID